VKNNSPKRITFVVGYLSAGGAERVISLLANALVASGYSVSFIYLKKKEDFYRLDKRVNKHYLDISNDSNNLIHGLINTRKRVYKLRNKIKQIHSDIVISFMTDLNVLSILACLGTNVLVIVSERTNPYRSKIPFRWKIAARIFYRYASKLVLQTERVKEFYKYISASKLEVIPNPLKEIGKIQTKKEKVILAVGRLEYPKGYDMLIEAFSCSRAKEEWKLIIAGEGRERDKLEQLAVEYNISSGVNLTGWQESIDELYARASVFVLSSRYEGFPNSLAEAMSAGLPCISFDCDFGPAEMIRHDVNGILVEPGNVEKLADEIDLLAADESERNRLGRKATEIKKELNLESITLKWENVFFELWNS